MSRHKEPRGFSHADTHFLLKQDKPDKTLSRQRLRTCCASVYLYNTKSSPQTPTEPVHPSLYTQKDVAGCDIDAKYYNQSNDPIILYIHKYIQLFRFDFLWITSTCEKCEHLHIFNVIMNTWRPTLEQNLGKYAILLSCPE